jgi:GntR family transcriptional regulator/MocR family aminotransferase
MRSQWSTSDRDLLLDLDRTRPVTLAMQLQEELRRAIREGRLVEGDALPSSRRLALDLGVSRGLVQASYEQLSAEGYLSATTGSGTRVTSTISASPMREPRPTNNGATWVDFSPGRPDLRSFPVQDWVWATSEATRGAPAGAFGYPDPRGVGELRDTLAAYLARVRGVTTTNNDIVVCNGFTQGGALALAVLKRLGLRSVAVEDPGHPDQTSMVERAGLRAVPIAVDEAGISVAALERSPAEAVLLTPAHQTPTGVVLSPTRRQALLKWIARTGAFVLEDDYDAEFRYDKKPVGSLQPLAPGHVFSIGSVSKSLGPALRLGWIVAPPHLAAAVAMEKDAADHGSSALEQLALSTLMRSGRFDRHLRRMRRLYATRRAVLVDALAVHAPGITLTGLPAGFHAVALLSPSARESEVIEQAAARSVQLHGLTRYRSGKSTTATPGIVFGFGDTPNDAIPPGIASIADLLDARSGP